MSEHSNVNDLNRICQIFKMIPQDWFNVLRGTEYLDGEVSLHGPRSRRWKMLRALHSSYIISIIQFYWRPIFLLKYEKIIIWFLICIVQIAATYYPIITHKETRVFILVSTHSDEQIRWHLWTCKSHSLYKRVALIFRVYSYVHTVRTAL